MIRANPISNILHRTRGHIQTGRQSASNLIITALANSGGAGSPNSWCAALIAGIARSNPHDRWRIDIRETRGVDAAVGLREQYQPLSTLIHLAEC